MSALKPWVTPELVAAMVRDLRFIEDVAYSYRTALEDGRTTTFGVQDLEHVVHEMRQRIDAARSQQEVPRGS